MRFHMSIGSGNQTAERARLQGRDAMGMCASFDYGLLWYETVIILCVDTSYVDHPMDGWIDGHE